MTIAFALAAAPAAASAPSARVWVTTPDGALKMSDQGSVRFERGGSDALTISVDPSRRYQSMDGFGASITDSSAHVLSRLSERTRDATMRSLFSPATATGSRSCASRWARRTSSPATTTRTTTCRRAGPTTAMRHFSIAHDRAEILPLLRQALALNPRIKVIGTPWSAPAWMKTNQSLIGGRLIDDPRIYAAYARYFVKFVQAYERAGVPVYAVTVQNEPQNRRPSGYPGMDLPVAQHAKLVEAIGQAFRAARIDTKIIGYDHNWSLHPDDAASTPPGEDPEAEYPTKLLSSRAGRWLAGTAFHCYSGDPSRQTELQRRFPDKGIWFTECSGSHGPDDPPAQFFSDTLKWHARNLVLGVTRNWGKTVVNWNLALDPSGGPHKGGCDTCTGVVTVGPGDTRDARTPSTTRSATSRASSGRAPSGSPARRSARPAGTGRSWTPRSATATARPRSSSTTRTTSRAASPSRRAAGRSSTRCRAARSRRSRGPRRGSSTTAASCSTRTGRPRRRRRRTARPTPSTTTPRRAGPPPPPSSRASTSQVDLGRPQRVRRVVLDTGVDAGDFPRGYELQASRDGARWRDGRERRRLRAADDDRLPLDHRALPARRSDRRRRELVVGCRSARLPLTPSIRRMSAPEAATYGVTSMIAPLRRVLVRRPATSGDWAGAAWRTPDPGLLARQHEDFCELLAALGPEVEVAEALDGQVDSVYMHDPMVMTARGGIALQMLKPARVREPEHAARELERLGVPLLGRLSGDAYADGGDRYWLDDSTMAIGLSYRTNRAGAAALAALVEPEGVTVETYDMAHDEGPGFVLHLQSFLSGVADGLCVIYEPLAPVRLLQDLRERGTDWIAIDRDSYLAMGCNVLAIRPGVVVMVDAAPAVRSALERRGVEVHTYDGSELSLKGDGGPTCLTQPLLRG